MIGTAGVAIVVVSLVFDDALHRAFGTTPVDAARGWISLPVVGTFLAAFGFGGALLQRAVHLSTPRAIVGGVVLGVALGTVTVALVRALLKIPPRTAPGTEQLVGALATVVLPIPEAGTGEVTVDTPGHRLRLPASADAPIGTGTTVVVIDVTDSDALVVTEPAF